MASRLACRQCCARSESSNCALASLGVCQVQRVVLLVRHPFDAIWSEFQRRQTGGSSHADQVKRAPPRLSPFVPPVSRACVFVNYLPTRACCVYAVIYCACFVCYRRLTTRWVRIAPSSSTMYTHRCRKCKPASSKASLHVWRANGSSTCSSTCIWPPTLGHSSLIYYQMTP